MVSMTKTSLSLLKNEAKASLTKHGIEADGKGGIKVRLVLDHSGSMRRWYEAGAVQRLIEQVLALAAALDDDGTIEVWYFGTDVGPVRTLSLDPTSPDYYVGWVDRTHTHEYWGSTNYAAAIHAAARYRTEHNETEPSLVIFQTDGGPDRRAAASRALKGVSGESVFFAFVVFGDERSQAADYVRNGLDEVRGRVRDNASSYIAGELDSYASVPDSEVYDGVLGEFVGQWLPQVL